jgi:hypothetical protein
VHDFAENNDSILLVVIPAASCRDVTASRALKLAQDLDHDGKLILCNSPRLACLGGFKQDPLIGTGISVFLIMDFIHIRELLRAGSLSHNCIMIKPPHKWGFLQEQGQWV